MCGRTACTLSPQCIQQLCSRRVVKDGKEVNIVPAWIDDPGGHKFISSFNLPPTLYSPVLISGKHHHVPKMDASEKGSEAVIQPMLWGLIPSWHYGDSSSFKFKMNNARSDGLLSKTSFKNPLHEGKRCVILCDGYYEWQTSKDGKKLPYFIYFSENSDTYKSLTAESIGFISETIKTDTKDFNKDGVDGMSSSKSDMPHDDISVIKSFQHSNTAYLPKKLLTMAGLFDISKSKLTGGVTFSYAIITVDAHEDYQFIHDRMPAILNDEKEVYDWLNYADVPLHQAMKLIRPTNGLSCHTVSSIVNNSKQNSPQCILPSDHKMIKVEKKVENLSKSGSFMMSWLGCKRKGDNEDQYPNSAKNPKKS